jgi:hypothetical protein
MQRTIRPSATGKHWPVLVAAVVTVEETPPFASMRSEERAVRERYNDQDPLV